MNYELPRQYLLQRDVRVGFSKHVLLQLKLAMLDGRDGDAVDVADGAVADAEAGEDAQADVVLRHRGVLLAEVGETVAVDGVERAFYLAPFVRGEGDERIAALTQLLHHLCTFEDVVLQECHHFVCLVQQRLLVLCLLLKPTFLLTPGPHSVPDDQPH